MAHFHTKTKKGRPYLYVREIARINGKPKVVSQTYIGSPEKVRELVKGGDPAIRSIRVDEFGALWLAMRADEEIDLANIVDEIIPSDPRETGPSVGEYFLYAILNRMIEPKSKRELPDWYRNTAIQEIRPVNVSELSSQRFGAKWDRVSPEDLEKIAKRFFNKVWEKEEANGDCLLFDTTNHYTYMSSKTPSELARRGKNKAGKHHLRQIGTALLVGRTNRLPLFYREYPGNLHDSNIFNALIGEMLEIASMVSQNKQRLTIIFDKGMNSDPNFEFLDDSPLLHFITTYSPYFASDFASLPLSQFAPLDIKKNRLLEEEGKSDERLMAYRTSGEFWGKKRAVIVTHNPGNARKQEYVFSGKLEEIRKNLLEMRMKFNEGAPHWKNKDNIQERYFSLCGRLHMASDYFSLEFSSSAGIPTMGFRKNVYRTETRKKQFGRNIIITDNLDWKTEEIFQASLDRNQIEEKFRQANDHSHVSILPIRHWTDDKIRCHLFCCVVALTYMRRLELRLEEAGIKTSASSMMEKMKSLHSVLAVNKTGQPIRRLETPSKTHQKTLSAFGWEVSKNGVLQKTT